jgi:hypothetical protein
MENSGGARENGKFLVDFSACGIGSRTPNEHFKPKWDIFGLILPVLQAF